MALNRKLSDKPLASSYSSAAKVHIFEPNDLSQSPTGSDYQMLASYLRDVTATHFKGDYSIVSNTPILSNTTGKLGEEYVITDAGTYDFGSGAITGGIGDILAHNGTEWFLKVNNNQSGGGGGSVPDTRELTINGVTYDLSADRSWTVSSGVTLTKKTITTANLTTLDVSGLVSYINGATSYSIASNEVVEYCVTDTGQVFQLLVNNRSVGSGQTALTSSDILELSTLVIDNLFPNKVLWKANGSTSVGVGALALTGVGTASQVVNYGGFDFYLKTASSAVAGTTISQKETSLLRVLINSGFYYEFRVKQNDASSISDVRFVYGLGSTIAIGNVEPSTISQQLVVFGADGTDTNCQIMYKANLGSVTKINLGASFPKSQTNDYVVSFMRFKNLSTVYYKVTNVTTGATTSGSFSFNSDALTPIFNKNNNASAISCAFELQRVVLKIQD